MEKEITLKLIESLPNLLGVIGVIFGYFNTSIRIDSCVKEIAETNHKMLEIDKKILDLRQDMWEWQKRVMGDK